MNPKIAALVLVGSITVAACVGRDDEHIQELQYRIEPLPTTGILNYTATANGILRVPLSLLV